MPGLFVLTTVYAVLVAVAFRLRMLDAFVLFGSGAYAEPIALTPGFLLTLALLAIAACVFVEAFRTRARGSPELLLLCVSACLLPVAF